MDEFLQEIAEDDWLSDLRHYMPSGWIGHAPFLKFLIKELKPQVFVELGTHNGFSYFVGCQVIKELGIECSAVAIDHWQGDSQAGFFDEEVFKRVSNINTEYEAFSKLLKMTFADANPLFSDSSIDLLHIDGHHSYDSVTEDFSTWLPKMKRHGVILLHDIHVRKSDFGVYKLWRELKTNYENIEFVGSHGLGVIFLGSAYSDNLMQILKLKHLDSAWVSRRLI
jgi:hypothetical protein